MEKEIIKEDEEKDIIEEKEENVKILDLGREMIMQEEGEETQEKEILKSTKIGEGEKKQLIEALDRVKKLEDKIGKDGVKRLVDKVEKSDNSRKEREVNLNYNSNKHKENQGETKQESKEEKERID